MTRLSSLLGLFFLFSSTSFSAAPAKKLTFATLNIKFYGNNKANELGRRDRSLEKYISLYLADSDVVAFQEIIDKKRFLKRVIKNKFSCQSYDTGSKSHLHTIICFKSKYRFTKAPSDTNFIMEETTLGRNLRPVLHGILKDRRGNNLAYILNVHLKANEDQNEARLKQIKLLSSGIKKLKKKIPTIILGDFNTHGNDVKEFSKVLRGMKYIKNPYKFTFRVPDFNSKLDHFWVKGMTKTGKIETSRICRIKTLNSEYPSVESYNREISDHCYLKATFILK